MAEVAGGYGYSSSSSGDSSQYDTVQGAQQQGASYEAIMAEINKKLADVQEAMAAGEGTNLKYKYDALKAQYDDAKAGRDNAYRIAQLQSDTQRYGYDQQRQTEVDKLKEDQRQYDSTHALDLKKYGLEVAKAYASYASTPDQRWAANDFDAAMGQVGQGRAAQSTLTSTTSPHAKTWEDFAALSGYSDLSSVSSGTTSSGSGSGTTYSASGSGSDSSGGSTGSGTVTATDGRQTAINAVTKAMPASDSEGHDQQDYAALQAIKALYFARKPGTVAALGAQRQKTAMAGLSRLGYDAEQVSQDYERSLPGQSSVRAA